MRIESLLKNYYPLKGFSYKKVVCQNKRILVYVEPHKSAKAICDYCGQVAPTYDRTYDRHFLFEPIWDYNVYLVYRMRRVKCPRCGKVVTERISWASGKRHICNPFIVKLAAYAKELSWKQTARFFSTSWYQVANAVSAVVEYGLKMRSLENVNAIGVDEIAWHKGRKFMSLVYQIDNGCKRLLWVGNGRTISTMNEFVSDMECYAKNFVKNVKIVCSDMLRAYLRIIADKFTGATNVLDRFHVMQKLNIALDEIRAQEHRSLKKEGNVVLDHTRFYFLKNAENLSEKQSVKLGELMKMNLNSVKAYLLKEQFRELWNCADAESASAFIDSWCLSVSHTNFNNFKRFARTIQRKKELLLNYFRTGKRYNSGVVEGLNRKVNLIIRRGFGYRSLKYIRIALYHQLGDLVEPPITHTFS